MHAAHAGQQRTTWRKRVATGRVARVVTIGAAAVLAIVLGTAQAASAGITSISVSAVGSKAQATVAGTTYGPLEVSISVTACDTKADGHHAEGWLSVYNQIHEEVKTVKAKAYGGNGTCVTAKATVACADTHSLVLSTHTMEGSEILSGGQYEKTFAGC
ncbi:hypothetical protein [Cellulomonas sp. URHB0016]